MTLQGRDKNRDFIAELANLLRENAEGILDGSSKLSLTSSSVCYLNECFDRVCEGDRNQGFEVVRAQVTNSRVYSDIQLLFDLVQKTLSLKLVLSSTTLQGGVRVARFRSLTTLEIKRMPIHLVVGLQVLRSQLQVIICSRCITRLQDVFATCGGDSSMPLSWPELHTINMSYNSLERLDDSLRLLQQVTVLDLSHNSIKVTGKHLEYLPSLTHLNLGYNQLEAVPTLSITARTKLQSLILKNNNLDNIEGVESFHKLHELDLSNNCLYDHSMLEPLSFLNFLHMLSLYGNPLSFHPTHRQQTARHLSPITGMQEMILDGKKLTREEINLLPKRNIPGDQTEVRYASRVYTVESDMSEWETSTSLAWSKAPRTRKSGRKVRNAAISDTEACTPAPLDDLDQTREEMEAMREQLGPDWLVASQLPTRSAEPDATSNQISEDVPPSTTKTVTTAQIHVSSEDISPESVPSTQTDEVEESSDIYGAGASTTSSVGQPLSRQVSRDVFGARDRIRRFSEQSNDSHSESQPFLVKHREGSDNGYFFVIIREKFIVEKDLDGRIMDKLETSCLKTVERGQGVIQDNDGQYPVVSLVFDYVRKDRQKREYVLIDDDPEQSCQVLLGLLEPIMETNLSLKLTKQYQCLKCSSKFSQGQAKVTVLTKDDSVEEVIVCPSCQSNMIVQLESQPALSSSVPGSKPMYSTSVPIGGTEEGTKSRSGSSVVGSLSSFDRGSPAATSSPWKHDRKSPQGEPDSSDYGTSENTPTTTPRKSSNKDSLSSESLQGSSTSEGTIVDVSRAKTPIANLSQNLKISQENKSSVTEVSDSSPKKSERSVDFDDSNDSVLARRKSRSGKSKKSSKAKVVEIGETQKSEKSDNLKLPVPESASHVKQETDANVLEAMHNKGAVPKTTFSVEDSKGRLSPAAKVTHNRDASPKSTASSHKLLQKRNNSFTVVNEDTTVDFTTGIAHQQNVERTDSPIQEDNAILNGEAESEETTVRPKRQDSVYSEIAVLCTDDPNAENPTETNRAEVFESMVSNMQSAGDQKDVADIYSKEVSDEMATSPLTGSTCTSMVASMYQSAISENGEEERDSSDTVDISLSEVEKTDVVNKATSDSHAVLRNGKTTNGEEENVDIYSTHFLGSSAPTSSKNASFDKLFSELDPSRKRETKKESETGIKFYTEDFTLVDHRMKLFLTMSVFGEEEEFECLIKAPVVQYGKPQERPAILVSSNKSVHILKVTGPESEVPSDWLQKLAHHPITELHYIDIGLGSQSFRLEFSGYGGCYTFLVRDSERCRRFLRVFTDLVRHSTISSNSQLKGITKNNVDTHDNIRSQVLKAGEESSPEMDTDITMYLLAYLNTDVGTKGKEPLPIAVVVTTTEICLTDVNHQWPLPRLQPALSASVMGTQFTLREGQKISNITNVNVYEDAPCNLSLDFLNEDTSEESSWHLLTETPESTEALVSAVKEPWEAMFGVDLQLTVHPTVAIHDM
ncbi:serine/threonine-protein kinase 11-interacting protein-like isoform X2 [Branchiostoma lanceolatum]|uniref:serine/threonine-protein kinase 11-interacting protein-like isoform X2 n=1 Tax=Branchiostoma lanceolatum TaxID=7740 RepID=UPI003455A7C0